MLGAEEDSPDLQEAVDHFGHEGVGEGVSLESRGERRQVLAGLDDLPMEESIETAAEGLEVTLEGGRVALLDRQADAVENRDFTARREGAERGLSST